jgi:hypothetical protein
LQRYLVLSASNTASDSYPCPDWYVVIAVAKYLGVAPWQLMEESVWWQDKAMVAMAAEAQAQKILNERK